jgi:polyisoprenyl-phosphate glycosyltransferase
MPSKYPDISIIIPIFNEQDNIIELHLRLTKVLTSMDIDYELIFINDGSNDNSLSLLRALCDKDQNTYYINFSRNFGHQIAVSAGLKYCKGKAIVIIDADLQDPPELIPSLFSKYKEGYDVVYAKRNIRQGESFFKKTSAKLFYRILNRITNISIPLDTGDFRLIDRKIVDYLNIMPENNKFLRGQIAWLGFKQTSVIFDREKRKNGITGYSISKMLKFAIDGITSFSDKPLEFVTKFGITFSILSILIIVYALYSHFVLNQTITGWTSLIVSTMFIGSIQLISIGILGEYISRINKNTLNRPLYIVESTNLSQNN